MWIRFNRVVTWFSFLDEGVVDEVEVRLPGTTMIFDIISKGCTLYVGVISLARRKTCVKSSQIAQGG
jgi:hypothetical protein